MFAILAEELGFIGGLVLFVLFVLLLWRVLVAGWRSRDPFGTLFAAGVASMILFQLVVNVGMVMGVMPITGIPLPFVTHGGASLVSMADRPRHPPEHQHPTDRAEWCAARRCRADPLMTDAAHGGDRAAGRAPRPRGVVAIVAARSAADTVAS